MAHLDRAWCRFRRAAGVVLTLLLLFSGAAGAQTPDPDEEFRSAREQGRHYFKKKMYGPARAALEKARQLGPGPRDFSTHDFLARTYLKLYMLEDALRTAQEALELARLDEQREGLTKLVKDLESQFGAVRFEKDPDQKVELKETFIYLKDVGGLINPEKKQIFATIQERWKKTKVELPVTIYLPFGKYKANGAPFEVTQGKTAQAALFMYLDSPEEGSKLWLWAGIAGGSALVLGGVAAALLLTSGEEEGPQQARFGTVSFLPDQDR